MLGLHPNGDQEPRQPLGVGIDQRGGECVPARDLRIVAHGLVLLDAYPDSVQPWWAWCVWWRH